MTTTKRTRIKKDVDPEYPIMIASCVLCSTNSVCYVKPAGPECISDWDCNRRRLRLAETQLSAAHAALDQADEAAKQLRRALRHYGRHLDLCSLSNGGFCDCGYSNACREPALMLTTLELKEGDDQR